MTSAIARLSFPSCPALVKSASNLGVAAHREPRRAPRSSRCALHRCARLLWLARHDRLEDPPVLARGLRQPLQQPVRDPPAEPLELAAASRARRRGSRSRSPPPARDGRRRRPPGRRPGRARASPSLRWRHAPASICSSLAPAAPRGPRPRARSASGRSGRRRGTAGRRSGSSISSIISGSSWFHSLARRTCMRRPCRTSTKPRSASAPDHLARGRLRDPELLADLDARSAAATPSPISPLAISPLAIRRASSRVT